MNGLADPLDTIRREPESDAPKAPDELIVGLVDPQWVLANISLGGPAFLDATSVELIGSSLLDRMRPSDHPGLRAALARVINEGVSVPTEVHVGRAGHWRRVRLMLSPMLEGAELVGFSLTSADGSDADARTTRLEQHLLRIARELEAAGVGLATDDGIDSDALPDPGDLSPRQWEILRRVLRGERVPGIAKELFLSPSTVRNHLTAIFAKVGVHSQEELITRMRRCTHLSKSA